MPITILIVDDSRASRLMTSALINSVRPGQQILEADSGAAALKLLAETNADIGILDMNMQGMSGLDLAKEILARNAQTPLALLTANVQDATRQRAKQLGVHFFRKPVTDKVIIEILNTLAPEG
jgi:CheY-like chemotaxis protein